MASAAEQLAANLNFSSFSKATDLKKRIWFTLMCPGGLSGSEHIFQFRVLTLKLLRAAFERQSGGILDMVGMFTGGAVQRLRDICTWHYAIYFRLHHHSAHDLSCSNT